MTTTIPRRRGEEKRDKKPTKRRIDKTIKQIRRKGYLLNREVRWMIVNLVAPEYLMAKAVADLISARWMDRRLKVCARDDGVEWSMMHTYYANMGGFVVRFEEERGQHLVAVGRVDSKDDDDDVESCQRSSAIISDDCVAESVISDSTTALPTRPITPVQNMQSAIYGLLQSRAWNPNRFIERVYLNISSM